MVPNYTDFSVSSDASATFERTNRSQQVFQALQFPSGPILIKEIRWRPSSSLGSAFSVTVSNVQIHLSTTTASAGGLSTTFASNVGADDTTVYNGPLSISSSFTGPSSGPKDMDIIVKLQTNFWYYPTNGNLLLDVKTLSNEGTPAYTEVFGQNGDTGSRVVALNPTSSTADFSDTGIDAVKFIYDGAGAVVAPNYTAYNTNAAASATFERTNRSQQVFQALQFPSGPILIKEIRWRPSSSQGSAFSVTVSNVQIHLSTTTASTGGLSTTFAANVGADDTLVFTGPLHISSAFTGPSSGPKDIDIVVKLQTNFWYYPTNGNLLLDVKTLSNEGTPAFTEDFGESGDTSSRVVALNPTSSTADFSDSGVDVVKFIYDGLGVVTAPNYTDFSVSSSASATFEQTNRSQQVFQAQQFPSGSILIKELRWRPAESPYGSAFSVTVTNVQIHLSTTTASAGGLSTTFASNVGADDTTVYSGPLSISSAFTGPSSGPRDTDIVVKLQTPFLYDSAAGNLLLDVKTLSNDGTSAYTQVFGESGDTGSRVVAINPSASTADFSDTGVDTVKFIYDRCSP